MSVINFDIFDSSLGAIKAPTTEPEPSQSYGWASPTSPAFAEVYRGGAMDSTSNSPDLVSENHRLKALVSNMSTQVNSLKTALAATNPVSQAPTTPPPRKRRASRVGGMSASPSKRNCPTTPATNGRVPGPIEAMWSPGVTPEQRRAMYDSGIGQSMPASQIPVSSPAASVNSSPSSKLKVAPKKARAPAKKTFVAPKKTPSPKKNAAPKKAPNKTQKAQTQQQSTGPASFSFDFSGVDLATVDIAAFADPSQSSENERSVQELYESNFMSLPLSDKARLLLPLLRGIDPAIGKKFAAPSTLGPKMQIFNASLAVPAATIDYDVEQPALTRDPTFEAWLETIKDDISQPSNQQPAAQLNIDSAAQPFTTVAVTEAQADVLDPDTVDSLLSYASFSDTTTSPGQGSSPDALDPATSSPASSHHAAAATTTTKNNGTLSFDPFTSFPAENTTGDSFQSLTGDVFDASFTLPLDDFNAQNSTGNIPQALASNTFADSFAMAFGGVTAQNSTDDVPQYLSDEAFRNLLASMSPPDFNTQNLEGVDPPAFTDDNPFPVLPGEENLFTFPSIDDEDMWQSPDAVDNNFFDFNQFPNVDNTNTGTDITPGDLAAGMKIALNGAATIGSPDSGAKRQREALEEHERRVAEGRRR